MLTMVEVRSPQGGLLSLPLEDPSSGVFVKETGGLDPVKATLVSSSFAGEDGEQYHSSHREARDVTLKLGIEPDLAVTTVRALRAQLYNFFMPKTAVNLRFYFADGLEVDINGRVEVCEAPHATQEPEMDVSIHCFKPDFRELVETTFEGETTSDTTELTINYTGSVETGILFTLFPDRELSEFTIYHTPPDGTLRTLDFVAPLAADDILEISTVKGAKGATVTTGSSTSPVLYGISPFANWIELQPGANKVRVYAVGDPIPFNMKYVVKHGGL